MTLSPKDPRNNPIDQEEIALMIFIVLFPLGLWKLLEIAWCVTRFAGLLIIKAFA